MGKRAAIQAKADADVAKVWEPFGERKLSELLIERPGPAISIFIPVPEGAPHADRDRLTLRAAIDEARRLLESDPSYDGSGEILEAIAASVPESWNGGGGGVVLFGAPEFVRAYRLPAEVPPLVVVGSSFHTRPLLRYLQEPSRFWILELSQGSVRLWAGDGARARVLDQGVLPVDMASALGYEYARDSEIVHRGAGRGRSNGTFSGHGVGDDDRDASLEKFFRIVDASVRETLGSRKDPIVLAAVKEHHPLFHSITQLETLTQHGIEASIHGWNPDRVHSAAWPLGREAVEQRLDDLLALWETAYHQGKGEMDLANLSRMAVAGRVRYLLTERDRRLWGVLDRNVGTVEVSQVGGDDPGPHAVELLDELSEVVLLHGGEVRAVSPERMPTETGVAGILR